MKKILLLSMTSLAMLMADFTLIGEQLVSTQSTGENESSTFETPLSTSKYLEPVEIPAYDPNDSTHVLITPTNGKWNESVINNLGYKHFYIEPGNYTGSIIWLRSSGTENDRRTLSLYDPSKPTDDSHPALLPDNKQADVDINFSGASYWTIDRLSYLDHGTRADYYMMEFNNQSTHNILNRYHSRNVYKGIMIRPFNHFNTVQNSYLNGGSHAGRVNDALGVGLTHSNTPNAVTEGTKIINNDIRNLGDGIQLIKTFQSTTTVSFPSTVIDSNRIWVDGEVYTNGDWDTNGYNSNGQYMVAENAIDLKAGSNDTNKPVIISNNMAWGYREIDTTSGQNSIGGVPFQISDNATKNVVYDSNIVFDSQWGMHLTNLNGTASKVINNILYDIGHVNPHTSKHPSGRDIWVLATPKAIAGSSTAGVPVNNNTIIDTAVNDAGTGRALYVNTNSEAINIKNNIFIDTINIQGDIANQNRDNTLYYSHSGGKIGGSNEQDMTTADPKMGNYTFEYERYTSNPKTKTLVGVISTVDSTHYGTAGSSIATAVDANTNN